MARHLNTTYGELPNLGGLIVMKTMSAALLAGFLSTGCGAAGPLTQHFKTSIRASAPAAPAPAVQKLQVGEKIQFRPGRAGIRKGSFAVLDGVAHRLKASPAVHIEIQGHTDSNGSTAANRRLSLQRANAVRTYLVGKGIASGRLTAVGFGDSRPLTGNDSEEKRAVNRRVDFVLVGNQSLASNQ